MSPRFTFFLFVFAALSATRAFAQITEPALNPSVVSFDNVSTYACKIEFNACGADGYIVLQKENSATTEQPQDGITYQRGDVIGDATVVYAGADTFFSLNGAMATRAFYFSVFAYNGSGSGIDYRQADATSANVALPPTMKGNYYDNLNPDDTTFVTQLKQRIRVPYAQNAYNDYDETMIAKFSASDAAGGSKSLTCVYSGQQYTYTPPFTWTPGTPFSREHTWCHSWMPVHPSTTAEAYTDYHHLFPVNQNQANGVRSNHPLGVVQSVVSSYLQGRLGYNANNQLVYEPRDAHKGDAARTLLYMALRYDGVDNLSWTFNRLNTVLLPALGEAPQDVNLLLQWHEQDPPDYYEVSRNDYVQHLQLNRNPFVDHPEYTAFIDFNTLRYHQAVDTTTITNATTVTKATMRVHVYPMPSDGKVNVETNCDAVNMLTLRWYNTMGAEVKRMENVDCINAQADASELPTGLYLLRISRNGAYAAVRWVKE